MLVYSPDERFSPTDIANHPYLMSMETTEVGAPVTVSVDAMNGQSLGSAASAMMSKVSLADSAHQSTAAEGDNSTNSKDIVRGRRTDVSESNSKRRYSA